MKGTVVDGLGRTLLARVAVSAVSASHQLTRLLHCPAAAHSIASSSDGHLGLLALCDGTARLLESPARLPMATIAVGGSPHFILADLSPSALSSSPQQSVLITTLGTILEDGAGIVIVLVRGIVLYRHRGKQ